MLLKCVTRYAVPMLAITPTMVDQRPIYLYVNPRGESRRWDRYNVVPQASTEIELLKVDEALD